MSKNYSICSNHFSQKVVGLTSNTAYHEEESLVMTTEVSFYVFCQNDNCH